MNPIFSTSRTRRAGQVRSSLLLFLGIFGLVPVGFPQASEKETAPPKAALVATLKRTTSGKKLDAQGFATENITLQKGMTYPVEQEDFSSVVLRDGEQLIKLNKTEVDLQEDDGSVLAGAPLKLISAVYWDTSGGRRYSVESDLRRMLPQGRIQEPVQILIGDYLLGARASEVNTQFGRVDENMNIRLEAPKLMALDVVYEYEGKEVRKTVREGDFLILP